MVHWFPPLVLGIYLGILVDPWLRSWIASKDWERHARGPAAFSRPEEIVDDIWDDLDWPNDRVREALPAPLSDDRT
jgi:hypothetical protein